MARAEVVAVLGSRWQNALRNLGPEACVRAGVLLARNDAVPEIARLDATAWPESRRQRMGAVLRQLLKTGKGYPKLNQRDWAGTLWAAAKCQAETPDQFLDAACTSITRAKVKEKNFSASDAARLFWASATLRWMNPAFLEAVASAAQTLLPSSSPQDLSNIIWASVVLRYNPDNFVEKVATAFIQSEQPPVSQGVSMVLWGLAKLKDEREGSFTAMACGLVGRLVPTVKAVLPQASSQHVANILWSYAKFGNVEEEIMQASVARMIELLPEAPAQHVARFAWASVRLWPISKKSSEMLLLVVAEHLHERIKTLQGMQRRWTLCSLQHTTMLCWAFARALPTHRVTRGVLRDAVEHVEEIGAQTIKAQERANILWAFSEAIEGWPPSARPVSLLKKMLMLVCTSEMRASDDSKLSIMSSVVALARLYPWLCSESKLLAERWLSGASRRCCSVGLDKFKQSEMAVLLRSMATCKVLHPHLLHKVLLELSNGQPLLLRPHELVMVLEAAVSGHLDTCTPELMNFVKLAVPRLEDFSPRELIRMLWSLVQQELGTEEEMESILAAGTAALRKHRLQMPATMLQTYSPSEAPDQADGCQLSLREWMSLVNSIEPLLIQPGGPQGPTWILELYVHPWNAWLADAVSSLAAEATVAARPSLSTAAQEVATLRYKALLRRWGTREFGPRWTPVALQQLGIDYAGCDPPAKAQEAIMQLTRSRRKPQFRSPAAAWLQVTFEGKSLEFCALDAAVGDSAEPASDNDDAPNISRSDHRGLVAADGLQWHAEFQVLQKLAVELKQADNPIGTASNASAFLYANRVPYVSCIGALLQVRSLHPSIIFTVAFHRGLSQRLAAQPGAVSHAKENDAPDSNATKQTPRLSSFDAKQESDVAALVHAVYRLLASEPCGRGNAVPLSEIGTDPSVRELWMRVCANSGRARAGKRPEKKRDQQDKLKYFLRHHPTKFVVEDSPEATKACLRHEEGASSEEEHFTRLVAAVEKRIAELMKAGKDQPDNTGREGFVPVEEVGVGAEVVALWKKCQTDKFDRIAYFLRHSDAFEIWLPAKEQGIKQSKDKDINSVLAPDMQPADSRSRVRCRL